MKYKITLLLITVALVLAFVVSPVLATDIESLEYPKLNPLKVPDVEVVTLDNGLRLYLLEDKSLPIFRASVRINCGSYLEPADKLGLADICGSVMRTGGTMKWSGDEIDELMEGIGGSVETSIGLGSGSASINVLSEYKELGLEVLAEILQRPLFDEDKIDLEKVQQRSVISRRNDNVQGITFREYTKVIYGAESPYARTVEYATIDAITRDDLIAFHGQYMNPQNVQMAIWGDFDKKQLIDLIKKHFGSWEQKGEAVPPLPEVDYKYDNQVFRVTRDDVNQTNIVMGHIGGRLMDDDYAARIVMNNVLGGGFGSRLFKNVRSKEGLAYAVFGVYTANISYPGVFYNFASTKSETTLKAVREIIKQIKSMHTDAPTDGEMIIAKDGYLNSFVFNFDTKSEVVNRMMTYDFYDIPDDFLAKQKDAVEQVTPAAVLAASQKNLRPDALRILIVGKTEDYEMALEDADIGPVADLDITIPSGEQKKELAVTPENLAKGSELINKAVTAAGGLEQFKKINSIASTAVMTLNTPQGEFPLPVEQLEVFPDKRLSKASVMGQTMYNIRNGGTGWKTDQTGNIVAKTEEDMLKEDKDNLRNTIRIFKSSGEPYYQAVYDGAGQSNNIECEYVVLLDSDGNQICRLAINSGSNELVGKSYWGETMMGEGNVDEFFSSYSEVSGVQMPMITSSNLNGQKISTFEVSEYDINGEVAPAAFDKPE